jgi:hypothetical protein
VSAPSSPQPLALLRITVCLLVLLSPDFWTASRWSTLPAAMMHPVAGWGWTLQALPPWWTACVVAQALMVPLLLAGLVGFHARPALALATLLGLYVLGIPQLSGTVIHFHHLLWLTAILAASPCEDAFSILSTRNGGAHPDGPAYTWPLRACWAVMGVVYFFPGLWKLRGQGLDWALSNNVLTLMHGKWLQAGMRVPWLRVDHVPGLVQVGALLAMAWEVLFFPSLFFKWPRRLAILGGLVFQAATHLWLYIDFTTLWACYIMFLPRLPHAVAQVPARQGKPRALAVVASCVLGGACWMGAAGEMKGWPFACYPTFHTAAPPSLPVVDARAVMVDGSEQPISTQPLYAVLTNNRVWGLQWSVLSSGMDAARGYVGVLAEHHLVPPGAVAVRLYRARLDVNPDAWALPPVSQGLILEQPLPWPPG